MHLDHGIEKGKCVKVDCPSIVDSVCGQGAVYFIAKLSLLIRVGRKFEKYPAQGGNGGLMTRSQKCASNGWST
jgi:hypothetical protein